MESDRAYVIETVVRYFICWLLPDWFYIFKLALIRLMKFRKYIDFYWERHQSHWNWILGMLSFCVFLLALWEHSIFIFVVAAGGCIGSLRKLPDPTPPFAWIEKVLESERAWLASPWGWKKGLQIFGLVSGLVFVLGACWFGSMMSLLLFVGLCVNIWCVHSNKMMGIDDL